MHPMRRTLAIHTGLAFLLAFFGAPFLHLHTAVAEEDHHHGRAARAHGAIVHAHFPDAQAAEHGDADVSPAEEHEFSLNVFAVMLKQPALPDLPFLIAARIEAQPLVASAARIVLQFAPHTHDPPLLEATNPRAPPA